MKGIPGSSSSAAGPFSRVLFLTIDSLRFDRLGCSGYAAARTPNLDSLAEHGVSCTSAFSMACGTQFSFPSIFTSSLPLDFGGYDRGIRDRPVSLPEILRKQGLYTSGFASTHWLGKFFHYHRGFDEFHQIFGVHGFWKNIRDVFCAHLMDLEQRGQLNLPAMEEALTELFREALEFALGFHEENEQQPGRLRRNRELHCYDNVAARKLISKELSRVEKDGYTVADVERLYRDLFNSSCVWHEWTGGLEIKRSLSERISNRLLRNLDAWDLVRRNQFKTPSAAYTTDAIIRLLRERPEERLFVWTHFLDIHCRNHTTGPLRFPARYKSLSRRWSDGSASRLDSLYDESLSYIDKEIGRIIHFLQESRIWEDTLIVISSDHGRAAGPPERGLKSIAHFFDEFIQVPLLFHSPHLEADEITHPCSTLDIAPSILNLLGLPPNKDFVGVSVFSEESNLRTSIPLEHLHKGVCDFQTKPLYLGVRTERFKYVWREFISVKDDPLTSRVELYDLAKDPGEKRNIADTPESEVVQRELHAMVKDRYTTLLPGGRVDRNRSGHPTLFEQQGPPSEE